MKIKNFWEKYSYSTCMDWVILIVCLIVIFIAIQLGFIFIPDDLSAYTNAIAVLSSIILATSAFICTLFYTYNGKILKNIKASRSKELRKNWKSIILWSSITALTLPYTVILSPNLHVLKFWIPTFLLVMTSVKGLHACSLFTNFLFSVEGDSYINSIKNDIESD
ncbi:Uncharacterised protein [Rothia dentocariosa]|jgi:hypothetical protein|uniref:Uncharacterized protein n=1 Tax=Rothia dentocariosa TaxID=2047 RepID=A0A3S5F7H1_9MICC|nr:Uncharacterised protein [Rothia dentocariosa]